MINARRKHNQIAPFQPNPDPVVALTPNIEEPRAIKNIPDLLILVQVLVEETLHFLFIDVAHFLWRHSDFIPVLVVALLSERIHVVVGADVTVYDAQVGQVGWVDIAPGVVREALVALRALVM